MSSSLKTVSDNSILGGWVVTVYAAAPYSEPIYPPEQLNLDFSDLNHLQELNLRTEQEIKRLLQSILLTIAKMGEVPKELETILKQGEEGEWSKEKIIVQTLRWVLKEI